MAICRRIAVGAITLLICGYRVVLAPLLIGGCKFHPSCSAYFLQAVQEWGPVRGSWLGMRRLVRCHPFSMGGLDPVPSRSSLPEKEPAGENPRTPDRVSVS